MNCRIPRGGLFLAALLLLAAQHTPGGPLTSTEKSDFQTTSRHADVLAFCEQLAKESPRANLAELGTSVEGRKLPLLILAEPPVVSPQEAAKSGRMVVFLMGNIHAGEVDGKEALLMLARDLAAGKDSGLLKDLIVLIAPIVNADGNEKLTPKNRPHQPGPADGVGIRANAQGLDLNRDFIKLETPEVCALVRLMNRWDPAVTIDMHTTNGSYHRYAITYDGPRHPATAPALVDNVRDKFLPDVSRRLEQGSGRAAFFYGNFSRDRKLWAPYPAQPRFGTQYAGLRGRIGILCESYVYAAYRERILASHEFARACLQHIAENKDSLTRLLAETRLSRPGDHLPLRHEMTPLSQTVDIRGFVEEERNGRKAPTESPRDYPLQRLGLCEATLAVKRPAAYLIPASYRAACENLQRHGIQVEELREDIDLDLEVHRLTQVNRAPAEFQGHRLNLLETSIQKEHRRARAGDFVVRTDQPLGTLAAFLLEPQSEDGLAVWNFFDEGLEQGRDFPVVRLAVDVPLLTCPVSVLPEDRQQKTIDAGGPIQALQGAPLSNLQWIDDEHYSQSKGGKTFKVHAETGKMEPYTPPAPETEKIAEAIAKVPGMGADTAKTLSRTLRLNPKRTAGYFEQQGDLYHAAADGSSAVRLTKSGGKKELISFSPNGQHIAFVMDNNLHVVDVATQTDRALTSDGSKLVSNGKADWVYFEEIFNRNWRAYWWGPDSKHIAFLRFDDTPVHTFTVIDEIPVRQTVEATPYPKAGDPNPLVKVGLASVDGGPVVFPDVSGYPEKSTLIIRAGFMSDGATAYFYVQDRAQTWLDFCTAPAAGGTITRLFRDSTKAWIDDTGPPQFLKDGSFLLFSERTGYKHLYHYERDGKPRDTNGDTPPGAVTAGEWAIRDVTRIDEDAGWVYFTASRDNALASNFYRVKLDGSNLQRLSDGPGDHRINLSPKAGYFIDTFSSFTTPTKVRLHKGDGTAVRTLDSNPVRALEDTKLGKAELLEIKTPDGFALPATLLKPPGFDPAKKYPVWLKVYAGPHTPTIRDAWSGGQGQDQALSKLGFIVFHCDPRSATGKGAVAAWAAYRQLGIPELKDLETAVNWLKEHPWVDGNRIGISGHSYGGFMTAYAMTHSKLFAAGIAGAPVTDWRNYDTIYTERYMNTPQENAEGYDKTSVVKAAKDLHGKLLIVHGVMDDNVHVQNSLQLAHELQRANKDFEMMFYPRARHGVFGAHYQKLQLDFMKRHLRPGE